MGIAYVAAAFGIVPGLLFVFDRLSRTPTAETAGDHDHVPFGDLDPRSVADEAETWLHSQTQR